MPITRWLITNRNVTKNGFGRDQAETTYWVSRNGGDLVDIKSWRQVRQEEFHRLLIGVADAFPLVADQGDHERQQHVTLFIHGYNNTWKDAARRYEGICNSMFSGEAGLGQCVMFTWPSDGAATNYLPDRADARASAEQLADVFSALYDWLVKKQEAAAASDRHACRAKTSVIAHSMGNYVVQKALQTAWIRKNQPLLVSLINQMVMVAADVDNDLFATGEAVTDSDGEGMMNLCYRITSLYSGHDSVLGLSAGLKHFGKRRLGRSGLDDPRAVPDNVWEFDCSPLFDEDQSNIHSAYFVVDKTLALMQSVLRGVDRGVIEASFPEI